MTRTELTEVPGVPETLLSQALLSGLPGNLAPAPWTCRLAAVVWFGRGGKAAAAALPPALRGQAPALGVVGGLVRYQDTPVGAYDEVLGLVASRTGARPWGNVAFMSVDSEASLVGGRTNWAMPKTLATFTGGLGDGATMSATGIDGTAWRVSATARTVGPSLPVRTKGLARQQFPDGRVGDSVLTGTGRARLAVVTVQVESEGPLASWLRPGRHLGAVVESATFDLAEPRF